MKTWPRCPSCECSLPGLYRKPPKKVPTQPAPDLHWNHQTLEQLGIIVDPSKLTPAAARAARVKGAKACGCFLCTVSLHPPKTFVEWAEMMAEVRRHNLELEQSAPVGGLTPEVFYNEAEAA